MASIIYILSNPSNDMISKVGMTTVSAQARADEYHGGGWKVHETFNVPADMLSRVESFIHRKLKKYNATPSRSGAQELFTLSPKDCQPLVVECIKEFQAIHAPKKKITKSKDWSTGAKLAKRISATARGKADALRQRRIKGYVLSRDDLSKPFQQRLFNTILYNMRGSYLSRFEDYAEIKPRKDYKVIENFIRRPQLGLRRGEIAWPYYITKESHENYKAQQEILKAEAEAEAIRKKEEWLAKKAYRETPEYKHEQGRKQAAESGKFIMSVLLMPIGAMLLPMLFISAVAKHALSACMPTPSNKAKPSQVTANKSKPTQQAATAKIEHSQDEEDDHSTRVGIGLIVLFSAVVGALMQTN